uniref:Uncharacterized protein n=1 Tax=Anguilla anguilla TaxID=7936 RepID=A0A0E9TWM5_ANGAN
MLVVGEGELGCRLMLCLWFL